MRRSFRLRRSAGTPGSSCSSRPPRGGLLAPPASRRLVCRFGGGGAGAGRCFHDDPPARLLPVVDSSHTPPPRMIQPSTYLLAHLNYARLRAPLTDPSMAEFRRALGPINALARATPGFVWSFDHPDDNGDNNAEHSRPTKNDDNDPDPRSGVPLLERDPLVMPQLSLWTNLASLQHFAFKSGHAVYLKRRREWFFPPDPAAGTDPPYAVCWWWRYERGQSTPTGGDDGNNVSPTPTLRDAFDRCQHLRDHGPSSVAFDFASAKDYPIPKQ